MYKVKSLIKKGANINLKNKDGLIVTLYDLCLSYSLTPRYLRKHACHTTIYMTMWVVSIPGRNIFSLKSLSCITNAYRTG